MFFWPFSVFLEALGFTDFKWLVSDQLASRFLDDANASWKRFGASYRRLGRGLEACWAVWEASWGLFRIYLKLLGASCRFSCGDASGDVLQASRGSKNPCDDVKTTPAK